MHNYVFNFVIESCSLDCAIDHCSFLLMLQLSIRILRRNFFGGQNWSYLHVSASPCPNSTELYGVKCNSFAINMLLLQLMF